MSCTLLTSVDIKRLSAVQNFAACVHVVRIAAIAVFEIDVTENSTSPSL